MRGPSGHRGRWVPGLALLLLAAALSLRVLGPGLLPAPKDGYVALCAGGEIVYLPASELGLDFGGEGDDAPAPQPCPWFGLAHAATVEPPDVSVAPSVAIEALPLPVWAVPAGRAPASVRARGPPALS